MICILSYLICVFRDAYGVCIDFSAPKLPLFGFRKMSQIRLSRIMVIRISLIRLRLVPR